MPLHPADAGQGRCRQPRVFFYVQHLLGTGHIKRAALLVEAMHRLGMDVHVISGGAGGVDMPRGVTSTQLPALRAKDHTFSTLVDEAGNEPGPEWLDRRRHQLLEQFRNLGPDIVILESYPFGRRKLRFELIPLLEEIHQARPRPLVVCSVRDIVQARSPSRVEESIELLRSRFDYVLVHGDPDFADFGESFPGADRIEGLHYTGYVAPSSVPLQPVAERDEVLVSGGGGAVSAGLLATACEARALTRMKNAVWRVLAGPNIAEHVFDTLRLKAVSGISVEHNRRDFPDLLRRCTLSVSQCGYNTVIDLLQARARAVVVPFEGDGESEQLLRAEKLAQRGLVEIVREQELNPVTLAAAIDRCAAQPRPDQAELNLDGAEGSARFLLDAWQAMQEARPRGEGTAPTRI